MTNMAQRLFSNPHITLLSLSTPPFFLILLFYKMSRTKVSNAGWEICSKPMECVLGLLYFETGIFFVVLYCWGALQFVFVLLFIVQLLHKLSIHADDGPMKLMKASFTEYQQFRLTVLLLFFPHLAFTGNKESHYRPPADWLSQDRHILPLRADC